MIYHAVTAGLTEEGRDRVDELLGDVSARTRIRERNRDVMARAGFVVAT